jgi:hypothetical protein
LFSLKKWFNFLKNSFLIIDQKLILF